MWRMGNIRPVQAVGYALPGGPPEIPAWLDIRKTALEDAARAAVRALLQASERNRPKAARGFISLEAFPNYYIDSGRWAANARFRVEIMEVISFAAH
jgi:hypothetical protein